MKDERFQAFRALLPQDCVPWAVARLSDQAAAYKIELWPTTEA